MDHMIKANSPSLQQQDDDDLLPEYDLSKIKFVRGKHAHWHGKPYSVTIHNGDGTATVQRFDGKDNMISEEKNVWMGDRTPDETVAAE
jgi:hypothetical protein